MSNKPITQFGRREAALAVQRDRPTKRSGHVALLLAGTVAVGGGAYALMPGENCAPNQPGMAAPANAGCSPRSSSSGALWLLQRRFLIEPKRNGRGVVRSRFRRRDARWFWVVRTRVHLALLRRRLMRRTMP